MTADTERVRGYLLAQAEKYDWHDLWPRVMGARATVLEALAGVSEEQARWRPPAGEGEAAWGILEVAQHLLGSTQNVLTIIERTARGEPAPKDPLGSMSAERPQTLAEARRALIEVSERLATVRQRLPEAANTQATVDHPFFGPLPSRAWFLFQRIHDTDHANQVNALKQAEGFPK